MIDTAILILNWNGGEDTTNCLKSLFPIIEENDYLFIIDNGSTDNSVNIILDLLYSVSKPPIITTEKKLTAVFDPTKKIYLVNNLKNLGFGGGNNTVLKKLTILNKNFKQAWLLNNDTIVNEMTLKSLKYSMTQNENIAVSGSLILNYPYNGTIQCSGVKHYKIFGVSKLINKNRSYKTFDKNKSIYFDYLNGASLMLNLDALGKIGYFDERFFLYSEEFDLQLRFQSHNYDLYLDLNSEVYHKLSGGTNKNRHLFYYYYNTSAVFLSKKHFSYFYRCFSLFNLIGITFIRTFPSFKNFFWGIKGIINGTKKTI